MCRHCLSFPLSVCLVQNSCFARCEIVHPVPRLLSREPVLAGTPVRSADNERLGTEDEPRVSPNVCRPDPAANSFLRDRQLPVDT